MAPQPVDVAVGARIRLRRRTLDLTQMKLARALGVTFQQVQKYERGANRVSASMLVKIAARLETTVAALVGEDGTEQFEPETYAHLAVASAPQLIAAYAEIEDENLRRALLTLATWLAGEADDSRCVEPELGRKAGRTM